MIVGPILSNSPVLMQPCRQGMHRILSKEGNHRGLFNVKKNSYLAAVLVMESWIRLGVTNTALP